jgi:hypothetical protein
MGGKRGSGRTCSPYEENQPEPGGDAFYDAGNAGNAFASGFSVAVWLG